MSHTVYSSLEELGDKILQCRDIVKFASFNYCVCQNSLLNEGHEGNDIIFTFLCIKDKYKFCEDLIGYPPIRTFGIVPGQFPVCEINDFVSLTIITKELMKLSSKFVSNTR